MREASSVTEPITPYAGTGGHSGTDTSRERAEREVADGTLTKRQQETLRMVAVRGHYGITVKELREITGWHHGKASAALTHLHMTDHLARLVSRRDRCKIYVLPQYVAGRATEVYHRNKANEHDLFEAFFAGWCHAGRLGDREYVAGVFDQWKAER